MVPEAAGGAVEVRPAAAADRPWLDALWRAAWGEPRVITGGRTYTLDEVLALVAWRDATRAGCAALHLDRPWSELVSLNANPPGQGIGTALVAAAEARARVHGSGALRVTTTNDNLNALLFYQKRGFRLVAVRPGAVDEARREKPAIPLVGERGIGLHDELVLARQLAPVPDEP